MREEEIGAERAAALVALTQVNQETGSEGYFNPAQASEEEQQAITVALKAGAQSVDIWQATRPSPEAVNQS
jgi:hypothetical protein